MGSRKGKWRQLSQMCRDTMSYEPLKLDAGSFVNCVVCWKASRPPIVAIFWTKHLEASCWATTEKVWMKWSLDSKWGQSFNMSSNPYKDLVGSRLITYTSWRPCFLQVLPTRQCQSFRAERWWPVANGTIQHRIRIRDSTNPGTVLAHSHITLQFFW